jgi:hypothetical protein
MTVRGTALAPHQPYRPGMETDPTTCVRLGGQNGLVHRLGVPRRIPSSEGG